MRDGSEILGGEGLGNETPGCMRMYLFALGSHHTANSRSRQDWKLRVIPFLTSGDLSTRHTTNPQVPESEGQLCISFNYTLFFLRDSALH